MCGKKTFIFTIQLSPNVTDTFLGCVVFGLILRCQLKHPFDAEFKAISIPLIRVIRMSNSMPKNLRM